MSLLLELDSRPAWSPWGWNRTPRTSQGAEHRVGRSSLGAEHRVGRSPLGEELGGTQLQGLTWCWGKPERRRASSVMLRKLVR